MKDDSLYVPFPARAGMNRSLMVSPCSIRSVPRTRGDEPINHLLAPGVLNRSPHARG